MYTAQGYFRQCQLRHPIQRIVNNAKCMTIMHKKHGLPIAEYYSGANWQD